MRIVWSSLYGRYSDSPRALYEALVPALAARGVDAVHVWLCDPDHARWFPAGVQRVPYGGPESVAALESADVVVANHYLGMPWRKRAGALYLQTWHGTPFKRIHADAVGEKPFDWDDIVADVARWDVLLSSNPYSTRLFPGAFDFTGEIAETGSPRNDRLLSPSAGAVRAALRRRLGIRDGVTAVLYTPTWRDDVLDADGRRDFALHLDLRRFADELGDDHVLLMRLHYLTSERLGPVDVPGVLDVSAYPEVADLYLAADLLVTDYSSTMFDFAVTGKPMIFYAYDLPHYRDRLRGFRLDYLAEVPGPVVLTTEELLRAIRDVAAVVPRHAERYARFRAAYCALDDGRATQRVLQRCFGIDPPSAQVVILAAGMGTRLGRSGPKPLTTLASGQTILHRQLDGVREVLGAHVPVTIVVGYQADVVREAVPGVWFAHNEHYHRTNTSKSLLRGLERASAGGVLWMNGDVVFDPAILEHVRPWIEADESFVCVNTASVADEEIKYTVDGEGYIAELSKTVTGGLGEAVGINYVSSRDRAALARSLRIAGDGDYFERGMELAIEAGHLRFRPVDISAYGAVEVDVEDDLAHANLRLFGAGMRVVEDAR